MSAVKVGQRVTVRATISHRTDPGSLQDAATAVDRMRRVTQTLTDAEAAAIAARGLSRAHLAGKQGGVLAVREADGYALVSDQHASGRYDAATGTWANAPLGPMNMLEWIDPAELEVG